MVFLTYPVELLLQFFICIIYTELLETVAVKSLEPAPQEDTRHQINVSRHHISLCVQLHEVYNSLCLVL